MHALLQVRHDGQFAHITHAQIARRVILSQTSALVSSGKSVALVRASRARYQRRFAIVTKRGAGCDGRRRHQLTSGARRGRAKSCCPDPPTLGSTPGYDPGGTEANKPGTPRRPRISRKPLCRERRCFGASVAFFFACEPRVRLKHPALPAPSVVQEGDD